MFKTLINLYIRIGDMDDAVKAMNKWATGTDKYFHCKAMCEAQKDNMGNYALFFGDRRETFQYYWKVYWKNKSIKHVAQDCEEDRTANRKGVQGAIEYSSTPCKYICSFKVGRPHRIPAKY